MADRWFYGRDANKTGPFSGRQLRELADSGGILPTDTIWKEGVEQGMAASKVKNLFPPATDPSPAVPSGPSPQELAAKSSPDAGGMADLPDEATAAVATAPIDPESEALPDDIGLLAETPAPAAPAKPVPYQKPVKKGRAVAGKGAIIVSQDGTNVKFKKKCTKCNREDSSWSTLKIANGIMRANFFCTKCRKRCDVELVGFPS